MTQLSVVIPSWNRRQALRACIESLKTTLPLSSEIIIVDNASSDGTVRMVLEQCPHVRLIKNATNLGFAAATNQGIAAARGAYVLLLNPETEIVGNAIRSMFAFLEQNLRYGACTPRLLDADGTTQRVHMRFPTLWTPLFVGTPFERMFPDGRELRRLRAGDFDYDESRDVEVASTTCLLMRKKALKRSRPLDEDLWLHYNAIDLCRRLWEASWRVRYLEDACVYHHGSAIPGPLEEFTGEYQENRLAYFRKHHGQTAGVWVKACVTWSVLDLCVREMWHRAQGNPEESLSPIWNSFQVFMKH